MSAETASLQVMCPVLRCALSYACAQWGKTSAHFLGALKKNCTSTALFMCPVLCCAVPCRMHVPCAVLYPIICMCMCAVGKGECPKIKCNTMTRGYIYDHPQLGHLKEDKTGVGPNRPHTCYLMCRQTANCSFWMYDIKSKEGERRLNQGKWEELHVQ